MLSTVYHKAVPRAIPRNPLALALVGAYMHRSIHSSSIVRFDNSLHLQSPGSVDRKPLYTFRGPEPILTAEPPAEAAAKNDASKKEPPVKSAGGRKRGSLKAKRAESSNSDNSDKPAGTLATAASDTINNSNMTQYSNTASATVDGQNAEGAVQNHDTNGGGSPDGLDPEGTERIFRESGILLDDLNGTNDHAIEEEGSETSDEYANVESKELELATKETKEVDDDMPLERYYLDTQKMYTSLKYAGFTDGQADTLMVTIRELMVKTMKELKEQSVPGWAAENEAYLFEAACSEIRNDIQASRGAQAEQMRSQVSRLQRDLELLQHEMNDLVNELKSDLEMDVNDRKDATKADENMILLKIQDLNSKITTDIKADVKSEIEALRWQATRRGLTGIIFVAGCFLIASQAKKDDKKSPKVSAAPTSVEEYKVPVLYTSEMDDYPDEIKRVDVI